MDEKHENCGPCLSTVYFFSRACGVLSPYCSVMLLRACGVSACVDAQDVHTYHSPQPGLVRVADALVVIQFGIVLTLLTPKKG